MKSLKNILRTIRRYTYADQINFFKEHKKRILIPGLILGTILYCADAKYTKPTPLNQNKKIQQYDPNSNTNNLEKSLNNK